MGCYAIVYLKLTTRTEGFFRENHGVDPHFKAHWLNIDSPIRIKIWFFSELVLALFQR